MRTLEINDDQLLMQLAEGTATSEDGRHLFPVYPEYMVLTGDGPRPAQQATWYLGAGQWDDSTTTTCGVQDCVLPDHVTTASLAKDDEDLALVQRSNQTLATLYRKAKNRGLLSPRTEYGG